MTQVQAANSQRKLFPHLTRFYSSYHYFDTSEHAGALAPMNSKIEDLNVTTRLLSNNARLCPAGASITGRVFAGTVASLVLAWSGTVAPAQTKAAPLAKDAGSHAVVQSNYGGLPLSFEANEGQKDQQVRFSAAGQGYSLFLTDKEAVLSLRQERSKPADVLRMKVEGSTAEVRVSGADRLPGTANYFIGRDQSKWQTNIATYGKVEYTGIYPGIDLVYYGKQRQLEYDFVVAPHADPSAIRLHVDGAQSLRLTDNGDLAIAASQGEIAFNKPVVYQEINGRRSSVDGHFELAGNSTLRFQLGNYDHNSALIIDPSLSYSTYLGGSGGDQGKAIAVDSGGHAFVCGSTESTDFPVTSGAFQTTNRDGQFAVFVTRFNNTGNKLLYSTYLSGSTDDECAGIAVDGSGDAYITGTSESVDYPVTSGAFQTTNNAAANFGPNAFVTRINSAGTGLIYSTFLGGNNFDFGTAIAVDSSQHAYVTGFAGSLDFPVTAGAYHTLNGSGASLFVTKVNAAGSGLNYSTFITSGGEDHATSIAVDSGGHAYVAGWTESQFYPVTPGAFQTVNTNENTGFVTKLNSAGSALIYSTYLGGSSGGDHVNGIAVDASGNAFLGGIAQSIDFPTTTGAFKTVNPSGGGTGFVTKLNSVGSALVYSTYLGGTDSLRDEVNAIAIDSTEHAFVTGVAYSTNFPTAGGPFQSTNHAMGNFTSNAFLTRVSNAGTGLLYSTYLGGSGNSSEEGDQGNAVAVDSIGNVYLTGTAFSTNFPLEGAFQSTNKSASTGTAFVSKFLFFNPTTTTLTSSANPQEEGKSVKFTAAVDEPGPTIPTGTVTFSVDGTVKTTVTLNSSGQATFTTTTLTVGSHTILATYSGSGTDAASSGSLTGAHCRPSRQHQRSFRFWTNGGVWGGLRKTSSCHSEGRGWGCNPRRDGNFHGRQPEVLERQRSHRRKWGSFSHRNR